MATPLLSLRKYGPFLEQEAGWVLEPVWTLCRKENPLPLPEIETRLLGCADCSIVTTRNTETQLRLTNCVTADRFQERKTCHHILVNFYGSFLKILPPFLEPLID